MRNQVIGSNAVNRSGGELTGGLTSFSGLTVRERRTIRTRGPRAIIRSHESFGGRRMRLSGL